MTTSPNSAAKGHTSPKTETAKDDPVQPGKSGSEPGTSDGPKPDKGLLPQGTTPALANESGSDVGTDDQIKIHKGL